MEKKTWLSHHLSYVPSFWAWGSLARLHDMKTLQYQSKQDGLLLKAKFFVVLLWTSILQVLGLVWASIPRMNAAAYAGTSIFLFWNEGWSTSSKCLAVKWSGITNHQSCKSILTQFWPVPKKTSSNKSSPKRVIKQVKLPENILKIEKTLVLKTEKASWESGLPSQASSSSDS